MVWQIHLHLPNQIWVENIYWNYYLVQGGCHFNYCRAWMLFFFVANLAQILLCKRCIISLDLVLFYLLNVFKISQEKYPMNLILFNTGFQIREITNKWFPFHSFGKMFSKVRNHNDIIRSVVEKFPRFDIFNSMQRNHNHTPVLMYWKLSTLKLFL